MFKKTKLIQVLLGLLCLVLIVASLIFPNLRINRVFDYIDGYFYDLMINLRPIERPESPHVVVIDIDDYSAQQEGHWPWPRDKVVELINQLKQAGVVVIAFDILFLQPEVNYALGLKEKIQHTPEIQNPYTTTLLPILDNLAPKVDNDIELAEAFKNSDVALGFLFHNYPEITKGKLPAPLSAVNFEKLPGSKLKLISFRGFNGILPLFYQANPKGGFVTNIPDSDGEIRHGLMLANYENKTYPSFALSIVMNYLMADTLTFNPASLKGVYHRGLEVGGIFIPIDQNGKILIPYYGPPKTMDTFSAADVLAHKLPANSLAGSIAIVGSSMILLADRHEAPTALNFPGVEIVANMVAGILSKQISYEFKLDRQAGILFLVISGILYALFLPYVGPITTLITYLVTIIALYAIDFWLFTYFNIYVRTSRLLFLFSAQVLIDFSYNFVLERRQKNKINTLFGQYLPPSHIEKLLTDPATITMEGDSREMTVFFSDIRNFTAVSECLTAKEVKNMLNAFFTPVTELIFKHRGTIDKYVGDMVVAFWGAPSIDEQHAFHGISAALDIQSHLPEINEKLIALELPPLSIGMGLNTGMMDVGDMGSEFRRSYTVLGDAVNLGSRLQDLTKFYGVQILVSEYTRDRQDAFFWYPVDKVMVKGRQHALTIYTPICLYEAASREMKEELAAYEQALATYNEQDWTQALTLFQALVTRYPNRKLYAIYAERTEIFLGQPPVDWNGVFVFHDKKG